MNSLQTVLKFIQKEHLSYDILHCHYYLSGLIGLKLKEEMNILFYVISHTGFDEKSSRS